MNIQLSVFKKLLINLQMESNTEKITESENKEENQEKSNGEEEDNEKPNEEENQEQPQSNKDTVKDILKIVTVNVGSIKAANTKGFLDYVKNENADIICIQETKLHESSSPGFDSYVIDGYYGYFYNSEGKKGYAGTCIYTKIKPISVKPAFKDDEGRVILIEYSNFYVINAYVPNAGQKLERLDYKVKTWNPKMKELMDELKDTKLTILCGDLNVAHQPIDVYDTKGKEKVAGYTPQERKSFDEFLKDGYTDVFRNLYPKKQQFSFFSYRFQMKQKGHGWRLDYFVIPTKYVDTNAIVDCTILSTNFSDHSPCVLTLDREKALTDSDVPIEEKGVEVLNSGKTFKGK